MVRGCVGLGQNGSTMIISMLLVISVAVLPLILTGFFQKNIVNRQLKFQTSASIIQKKVQAILNSSTAWQATIADPQNGNLNCFKTNSCSQYAGLSFNLAVLHDEIGNVYYTSSDSGLTHSGLSCQSSDSCPFYLKMNWSPSCVSTACQANIQIQVYLRMPWQLMVPFNPNNYMISAIN